MSPEHTEETGASVWPGSERWMKHERTPLHSRTNVQSSGSLLAALRTLWNWGSSSASYLLRKSLPARASHPLFSQFLLPFTFSFIFLSGFVATSLWNIEFFSWICCVFLPISYAPLLILQPSFILCLHSRIPLKSSSILCSSLSSMSFFYLSFNFFQPCYQSFSVAS